MRSRVGAVVVACCMLVACSGGDDTATETGPADSSTTTSAAAGTADPAATTDAGGEGELTDSWRGVTADTIRLGFVTIDYDQLRSLGLVDIDPGEAQVVVDAVAAELNDRGGILGRRVEIFLEKVLPIGTTEAEAACLRLTQDHEVFAVLGSFEGLAIEANSCFTELNETIQVGGSPLPDQLDRAKVPWLTNKMGSQRRLRGTVRLMHEAGLFGERVGVVAVAAEQALADDVVVPALEEFGIEVADRVIQTADSIEDTVAVEAEFEIYLERFRLAEIDTVVLIQGAAVLGANELVAGGYEGRILVVDATDQVGAVGRMGRVPPDELAGIIGSGESTGEETIELAASRVCVDALEAADPSIDVKPLTQVGPGEPEWIRDLRALCANLRIFELAATAAGRDLTPETFRAGAEGLGEIDVPFLTFASLGPGKWDASDELRLAEFDPEVREQGGTKPFGPLERID